MGNPSSCFYVGGICGQTINGEISNCLTGPSTMHIYMQFSLGKPLLSTGGLIGKADGNYIINNSVSLAECSNSKESTPGYNINNYWNKSVISVILPLHPKNTRPSLLPNML